MKKVCLLRKSALLILAFIWAETPLTVLGVKCAAISSMRQCVDIC